MSGRCVRSPDRDDVVSGLLAETLSARPKVSRIANRTKLWGILARRELGRTAVENVWLGRETGQNGVCCG